MERSAQQLRDDSRERDLLRQTAGGDRQAFEALYCAYFPRLCRFLGRLTPQQELIEEAVNDTFWVVWRRAAEFRGQSQVSTWILGIAYRCCLKSLRRERRSTVELSEDLHATHEPAIHGDLANWLDAGLRQLPADQSLTLELAYYSGHSCEEIAEIMDCPLNTVKARLFRARIKLRNTLPGLGGLAAGETS